MFKILILLKNCDSLDSGRGVPVQGGSGKIYGTAIYERAHAGHVLSIPLEDFKECARDIVLGATLPLSKWMVADVTVEGEGDSALAEALELSEAQYAQLQRQVEAQLSEVSAKLAEALDQRDAAIRAIPAPQEPVKEPEAAPKSEASSDLNTEEAPKETPTEKPPAEETPIDKGTGNIPVSNRENTEPQNRREELEAITNFRALRKLAMDAGVPGADAMHSKAEIIEAFLSHETAGQQDNG